jgi:peptide chain release factor 2
LPCGGIFDAPAQKQKLAATEAQISAPDFWSQPERSQKVMQDRKRLEEFIGNDSEIHSMTDELDTLFELAREGEDVSADIARGMKPYAALLERLETAMLLSGKNDARSAIITIHPGAGGTESQDWAEMLLRM